MRATAPAVAAQIRGDDSVRLCQLLDLVRLEAGVGGEAVHEQDRLARTGGRHVEVDAVDLPYLGLRGLHLALRRTGGILRAAAPGCL